MKNRFDLEQELLDCWKVTDDVKLLYDKVMNDGMTTDEVANVLLGLVSLYELKFGRCWETFEDCVGNRDV